MPSFLHFCIIDLMLPLLLLHIDNSDADPNLYKDDPQQTLLHLYHHLITQPTLVPCHTRSSDSSTPSNVDPRVHPYATT